RRQLPPARPCACPPTGRHRLTRWRATRVYFLAFSLAGPEPPLTARSASPCIQPAGVVAPPRPPGSAPRRPRDAPEGSVFDRRKGVHFQPALTRGRVPRRQQLGRRRREALEVQHVAV